MLKLEELRIQRAKAVVDKDSNKNIIISALIDKLTKAEKQKRLDEKNNTANLTVEEQFKVVSKEIKETNESIDGCKKADRLDTINDLEKRLEYLNEYFVELEKFMPKQLNAEEIMQKVKEFAENLGREVSNKDKGLFMKELNASLKGIANGKLINEAVSKYLS